MPSPPDRTALSVYEAPFARHCRTMLGIWQEIDRCRDSVLDRQSGGVDALLERA